MVVRHVQKQYNWVQILRTEILNRNAKNKKNAQTCNSLVQVIRTRELKK